MHSLTSLPSAIVSFAYTGVLTACRSAEDYQSPRAVSEEGQRWEQERRRRAVDAAIKALSPG